MSSERVVEGYFAYPCPGGNSEDRQEGHVYTVYPMVNGKIDQESVEFLSPEELRRKVQDGSVVRTNSHGYCPPCTEDRIRENGPESLNRFLLNPRHTSRKDAYVRFLRGE